MSWVKRRGQANQSPAPVPSVAMFNPNQPVGNQWQASQNSWYDQQAQLQHQQQQHQPQQHEQQQLPPAYQQQYWSSNYSQPQQPLQQPYSQDTQQFQSYQDQSQTYQNNPNVYDQQNLQPYGNVQYNNQFTQNNAVSVQQLPKKGESDSWNWGWGDEDNSNVDKKMYANVDQKHNDISNNLGSSNTWNWTAENGEANIVQEPIAEIGLNVVQNLAQNDQAKLEPTLDVPKVSLTLDLLTASGRRAKLDTPQWSVESQMSQESSDDVLQTSESDIHGLSRSSTISHSPISGQDPLPIKEETRSNNYQNYGERATGNDNFENKEIVKNESVPPPLATKPPPVPTPPASGYSADSNNPYKRIANVQSHKNLRTPPNASSHHAQSPTTIHHQPAAAFNQSVNLETLPDNSEHPDSLLPHHQHRATSRGGNATKNVQQWPDNNEVPINDRNQYLETGRLTDVDSRQDFGQMRNERVQLDDALPPPGLRRMVLGQIGQNEVGAAGGANSLGDEPPPGLSRMVLGQNQAHLGLANVATNEESRKTFEPIEPPEGLRRMIPGESSSPESSLRQQTYKREESNREDDSEAELNDLSSQPQVAEPRSATIGADTPPTVSNAPKGSSSSLSATNRSETIGADTGSESNAPQDGGGRNKGESGSSIEGVKSNVGRSKHENNRRNFRGAAEDEDLELTTIANSIRNLTVGENTTDGLPPTGITSDIPHRRLSKQEESSDSEREQREKSPREFRDRRYKDQHRRDRDYSPLDAYRREKHDKRRSRDRRYKEDTDYYSDKDENDRRKETQDREYERKYHSLRKDKEKDRRKRDPREYDPRDPRRNDYYYGRYDEHYDNKSMSRPSSRSDSMHDTAYRRHQRDDGEKRNRDRERDRHRRPRDQFSNYSQNYSYDPYNPYYQQYQYYENLRRTNPQAYAEWYRKYYQQTTGHQAYTGTEDRASVHSGRSSANDELAKDSFIRPFDQTDSSLLVDDKVSAKRLTPKRFPTVHAKGSISSGKLVKIVPHYLSDDQAPTVDLIGLETLLYNDEEFKELTNYPGPLIKGITHKKTLIEYCENKIREASHNYYDIVDPDSYVLMWELLILLLRQNGMVVGADIAELLLKSKNETLNRPSSVLSNLSSSVVENASESLNQPVTDIIRGSTSSIVKEEEVTNKFREYLLYGSCKEALEWAMKHGLWGHALFLASKLDKRTYANVMMRFANGLTMNDPLQTLYQLLSGRTPAAVTCVADEKWGDWKPHLAMILSNSTQRPELNRKAITSLGDTLMVRGSLYAAQFCYLMAEVGFGRYGSDGAKLVLLGSNHNKPFLHFATNEAIHMTEIYEYACSLNDSSFALAEFQPYKYLIATRLADRGLLEKSLAYLEIISVYIIQNPTAVLPSLVNNVCSLADKLKYYDPIGDAEGEESEFGVNLDSSRPDNSWLKDLRVIQNEFDMGLIKHDSSSNLEYNHQSSLDEIQPISYDTTLHDAYQQPQMYDQQYNENVQPAWQESQPSQETYENYQQLSLPQPDSFTSGQYLEQQQYWPNQQEQQQQQQQHHPWNLDQSAANHQIEENSDQVNQNYYNSFNAQTEDVPPPQISMPNQSKGRNAYGDEALPNEGSKSSPALKTEGKPASTGWFGGIFSKLALKPKNQMKLPDDKNPSIMWDQEKKRWINVDEDNNEAVKDIKPPPKLADIMPKMSQTFAVPPPGSVPSSYPVVNISSGSGGIPSSLNQTIPNQYTQPNADQISNQAAMPGAQPTGGVGTEGPSSLQSNNMFKLQRNRNLKKSYVDVFNPNGTLVKNAAAHQNVSSLPSGPASMPNFFIPQPMNDPNAPMNFLTPAPQSQLQREESAQ